MPETRQFSAEEITEYLTKNFGHSAQGTFEHVNEWLERGDGIAVYENCELGIRDAGAIKLVSYGGESASLVTDTPPVRLPDTAEQINWRYQLYATYRSTELDVPAADVLGIPADMHPRRVSYTCALDNYEPVPRKVEYGSFVVYDAMPESTDVSRIMRDTAESEIPAGSIFIIDDGKSAQPYYSAGTNPNTGYEILCPFPVNPRGQQRPDGRVIDYSSWLRGPRKMYHLKVS